MSAMLKVVEKDGMESKNKALDAALAQIERAFGKGSIMKLGQREAVEIESISTGSLGLDIALGIDEGAVAALLLGFGDDVQRERGLARAFRAVDLDDAALGQATDAERDIEAQRAGRDRLDLHMLALAELHDRSLAEGALDLEHRGIDGFLLVHGILFDHA